MNVTTGTLRQLFEWLYQEQQRAWYNQRRGRKPSAQAQETWEYLIGLLWPIDESDFEHWFPASSNELHIDFSERRKVLYLPPLEKNAEFIPALSMKCDLDNERTKVELRVMLIRRFADHEGHGEARFCGIGFRLESSHGDEEEVREEADKEGDEEGREGRHEFYHAQLIRDLGWGPPIECPTWLPCTQPSFPLTADCPVTLMLSLLLVLYGKRFCWDFVTVDTELFHWLKSYIYKLQPWIRWKALV